jgi:hypothetical protein
MVVPIHLTRTFREKDVRAAPIDGWAWRLQIQWIMMQRLRHVRGSGIRSQNPE